MRSEMRFTGSGFFAKYGPYPDRNLSRSRTWRKDTGGYGADPESRDRQQAGFLMPAKGLTLMEVKYK